MHADERGGVAGGGKEVATVAAREGGERKPSKSHAKSGLSQTFGTYCWADLADLSVT